MVEGQAALNSDKQLVTVQVLRAYAALLVAVGHSLLEVKAIAAHHGQVFEPSFLSWGFGVDVFFVISGFIMTYAGARGFGQRGGSLDFIIRRLIRIVPLYWVMTLLVIAGSILAPSLLNGALPSVTTVVTSLLFIPAYNEAGAIMPILTVGWSLNYEMFFYVAFAVCMFLPRNRGLLALAVIMTLCVALGMILQPSSAPLRTWTGSLSLEFLFGVGIAAALMRGWTLGRRAHIALAVVAAIAGGLAMFDLIQLPLPRFLSAGVPAALMVITAVTWSRPRPSLPLAALTFMGDASYSLYLTHLFTLRIARKIWEALGLGGAPGWLFVVAALSAAIVAALLCYVLLERPMTNGLKSLYAKWRGRRAVAATNVAPS